MRPATAIMNKAPRFPVMGMTAAALLLAVLTACNGGSAPRGPDKMVPATSVAGTIVNPAAITGRELLLALNTRTGVHTLGQRQAVARDGRFAFDLPAGLGDSHLVPSSHLCLAGLPEFEFNTITTVLVVEPGGGHDGAVGRVILADPGSPADARGIPSRIAWFFYSGANVHASGHCEGNSLGRPLEYDFVLAPGWNTVLVEAVLGDQGQAASYRLESGDVPRGYAWRYYPY